MLTNHTNLTQSATQTLLTIGTRSLALVVDVNKAQANAPRCHKRFHLHVGPLMSAGMTSRSMNPDPIRIHDCKRIPGSPLGEGWPGSGQSESSSSWSLVQLPSRFRDSVRRVVTRRRVVRPGQFTGIPVAIRAAFASNAFATANDRAPFSALAAWYRPALMGG